MHYISPAFVHPQLKQAEGQSEAVKRRELQEKIEHLRAEISHLDTQISGAEDQLATEGWVIPAHIIHYSSLHTSYSSLHTSSSFSTVFPQLVKALKGHVVLPHFT